MKGLLPGRVLYQLVFFQVDSDDELVPYELPTGTFFRNAGKSRRRGVEFGLGVEPVAGLRASVAYTYSSFHYRRYTTPDGDFGGNRLPGVPHHQVFAELAYRHGSGFHVALDGLWVGTVYADDANGIAGGRHWVSSLRFGHRFELARIQVEPFFGINNRFDRRYRDNLRINPLFGRAFEPAPGRNLYGGLALRWSGEI